MVTVKKGKVSFNQESLRGESNTTVCGAKSQLLAVMLLNLHNGQLLVAVDHNQQRTMASETVHPIDWQLTPPSWAVLSELLVHSINLCNLCLELTLQPSAYEATTLPMRSFRVWALTKNITLHYLNFYY